MKDSNKINISEDKQQKEINKHKYDKILISNLVLTAAPFVVNLIKFYLNQSVDQLLYSYSVLLLLISIFYFNFLFNIKSVLNNK